MARVKTFPWDPAEHLRDEEDMAMYLSVVLEDGDLPLIMAALGDIARAKKWRPWPRLAVWQEKASISHSLPTVTRNSPPC